VTRTARLLAILGVVAVVLPWIAGPYALSVATLILYFAFTGQAWNVMMGFAGQLSLGHALYVGIGGYAAGGLYFHLGIGPWLGLPLAIAVAALVGVIIGWLAFRFGVAGVYFALLTIAFAEFTRIGFDHMAWTGGPGGMFLPVAERDHIDLIHFRGPPALWRCARGCSTRAPAITGARSARTRTPPRRSASTRFAGSSWPWRSAPG
jgi:branched-chain amino acid transport system permease protein